jgi:mRNA-degrading endonuclease RelE of RelBE toxin-antitoxin system
MKVFYSETFLKEYKALPEPIRNKFKKQLGFLETRGVTYPGLNARKMANQEDIWEARIDYHYRFTFWMQADTVLFRRIGTHGIYRNP